MRRWLVLCEVLFVSRPPDWQASIFLCLLWRSQLKRCLVSSAPGGVVCCQVDATTKQASFKRQPAKDGALPTVRYLARTVANNYFHINQSVNYLFYIFFLNCPSHFQNPIQGVDSNVLVSVQWEKQQAVGQIIFVGPFGAVDLETAQVVAFSKLHCAALLSDFLSGSISSVQTDSCVSLLSKTWVSAKQSSDLLLEWRWDASGNGVL